MIAYVEKLEVNYYYENIHIWNLNSNLHLEFDVEIWQQIEFPVGILLGLWLLKLARSVWKYYIWLHVRS